ncbi:MAG TPA: hypothetical protein VMR70_01490 [Flavisolibacter sp.]|nr:hypothetical protein [Flavisolibacter sp.]
MIQQIKQPYTALFVSLSIFLAVFTACSKPAKEGGEDLYSNSPASAIPAPLKGGIWFWGNIGPIAYYDRDGHQVGNETEAAREYVFTEVAGKGRFEFTQYLGLRNASNCVTEVYTTKKGTVVFEGTDKLTLYPVEGSFKTIKKGCGNTNGTSVRKAEATDLKPETLLWELKTAAGRPVLYVYLESDTNKEEPVFVYSFSN